MYISSKADRALRIAQEASPLGRGRVFWVRSTVGSDANPGTDPDAPLATIDAARALCTADRGDIIYVMQGHAENIANATDLVCSVAGVSVIGLGEGNQVPALTLTTAAAATISITAASVALRNVRIIGGYAGGVNAAITLGGGADGAVLDGLVLEENTSNMEFLIGISIAADCDDVTISNCYHDSTSGDQTSIISALGAANRLRLLNNILFGNCVAAAVKLDVAASTSIQIEGNRVSNFDTDAGLGIAIHDSSTGWIHDNYVMNYKDTVVGLSGAGMSYGRNFYSNTVNKSCRITPAEDT